MAAAVGALWACAYPVQPAECAIDSDCGPNGFCVSGACHAGSRSCPVLRPAYGSIERNLLRVGCGAGGPNGFNCHSAEGARSASGLDFSGDAYGQMVNQPSLNVAGDRALRPLRVKPGDPDASFLITKLKLTTARDPRFGSGMPADAPGLICPSAQEAVAQWIREGAPRN